MSDGYTDHDGEPISGMPYNAMIDEHERRMGRVTLEAVANTLWQNGGNYTRRQVAECKDSDMAQRIAHRWNTWGELLEVAETVAEGVEGFGGEATLTQACLHARKAREAVEAVAKAKPHD